MTVYLDNEVPTTSLVDLEVERSLHDQQTKWVEYLKWETFLSTMLFFDQSQGSNYHSPTQIAKHIRTNSNNLVDVYFSSDKAEDLVEEDIIVKERIKEVLDKHFSLKEIIKSANNYDKHCKIARYAINVSRKDIIDLATKGSDLHLIETDPKLLARDTPRFKYRISGPIYELELKNPDYRQVAFDCREPNRLQRPRSWVNLSDLIPMGRPQSIKVDQQDKFIHDCLTRLVKDANAFHNIAPHRASYLDGPTTHLVQYYKIEKT